MRNLEGIWGFSLTVARRALPLIGGGSILMIAVVVVEHYSRITVPSWVYGSIVVLCIGTALFNVGLEKHQRLLPRLKIPANVYEQQWLNSSGIPCSAFYIDVVNDSDGTSIDTVSVKLTKLEPTVNNLDWLPVPLFIKHDNNKPYTKSFILNPRERRCIDLVSAIKGDHSIDIRHTVDGVNSKIPSRAR